MPANEARLHALFRRLHDAEESCARRKQAKPDAIALRARRGEQLLALARKLLAAQWRPAPGLVFVTTRPKHREVHAARYSDRVVHHLIAQDLAPAIDRRLCANTFACRTGKGTQAAVACLQKQMWALSQRGKVRVYVLQMDIVNFFHTIDRGRLWRILQGPLRDIAEQRSPAPQAKVSKARVAGGPSAILKHFKQLSLAVRAHRVACKSARPPYDIAAAVRALLDDEPAQRAVRVGDPKGFARVPPHKRLRDQPLGIGLPIGNLTSQWFANAYLSGLDGFVQRQLSIAHYVRYMDDFILLSTDKAQLERARTAIVALLRDRLGLEVHVNKPIVAASQGIDFCGAIVRPAYRLPRRRVVLAWQERIAQAAKAIEPKIVEAGRTVELSGFGYITGPCAIWPIDGLALDQLRAAWTSGFGCTGHTSSRRLQQRMWRRHPKLGRFLARRAPPVALRHGDPAAERGARVWATWRDQRSHLLASAQQAVLIARVGRNLELLRRVDARRCGAERVQPRWPYARTPAHSGGAWIATALSKRCCVALAVQLPDYHGKVRGRAIRWLIEPLDRYLGWQLQFGKIAESTPLYRRRARGAPTKPQGVAPARSFTARGDGAVPVRPVEPAVPFALESPELAELLAVYPISPAVSDPSLPCVAVPRQLSFHFFEDPEVHR